MALVASEAIVLRTYNLAEADRIAVCLTRSAGLVRAVAKGARRMKSRFGAALEPYSFINLVFHEKENRELVTISQAEILSSHFDLAAQPEAGEALAYIAELVGDFAPPHEANEKLYRMVKASVEALAVSPENAVPLIRYFEVWLLRLAGLLPELDTCAQCDRAFRPDEAAFLDPESRPRCRSCSQSLGAALAGSTRTAIAATRRSGPQEFVNRAAELPVDALSQLAEFTHRLLVRTLERRPRTAVPMTR